MNLLSVIYIARRSTYEGFIRTAAISFNLVVFFSIWAVFRGWGIEVHPIEGFSTGVWQGIFTNRNFLATAGLFSYLFGILYSQELLRNKRVQVLIPSLLVLCVDFLAVWHTQSDIGRASLFIIPLILFSVYMYYQIAKKVKHSSVRFGGSICLFLFSLWLYLINWQSQIFDAIFSRNDGISGRVTIWHGLFPIVGEKFLFGHGWMSALWNNESRNAFPEILKDVYWSHSFHLDVALSFGLMGMLIYFYWVSCVVIYCLNRIVFIEARAQLAVLVFTLMYLSMESLSAGMQYVLVVSAGLLFVGAEENR
jgi:O-antigen ligase